MIRVLGWAWTNWDLVEGLMARDGFRPTLETPLRTLVAVWFSYLAELRIGDVRAHIAGIALHSQEEFPAASDQALDALRTNLAEPIIVTWETWGTSPQAEEAQRAMMDLAGGPAPLRTEPLPARIEQPAPG